MSISLKSLGNFNTNITDYVGSIRSSPTLSSPSFNMETLSDGKKNVTDSLQRLAREAKDMAKRYGEEISKKFRRAD